MVRALGVAFELETIEVHLAQIAGAVALRLVAEVRRRGVPALAAGGDGSRLHNVADTKLFPVVPYIFFVPV